MALKKEEKIFLLKLARKTLESYFEGRKLELKIPPSSGLSSPCGAFVTLYKQGKLRGCIGNLQGKKPLYQVVQEVALSAALNDPRFSPLSGEELPEVEIEISVLSPLRRGRPEEVKVGQHGLYLVKDHFRGVLLPQVAVEYGWDRETFLEHVCLKAGLEPGCWQDPQTELYLFTAEVFREKNFGLVPLQKIFYKKTYRGKINLLQKNL